MFDPSIHNKQSIRLKGHDYASPGDYFVTICTKDRHNMYGKVLDGGMVLNEFGKIVKNEWLRTKEIRKNVELGKFVVMPNHFHGIVTITYKIASNVEHDGGIGCDNTDMDVGIGCHQSPESQDFIKGAIDKGIERNQSPEGEDFIDTDTDSGIGGNQSIPVTNIFGSQGNNLFAIVRGFKGAVTTQINALTDNVGCGSIWLSRFYDRVIRNEWEYDNVHNYIKNNPQKWWQDIENGKKFNTINEKIRQKYFDNIINQ